MIVADNLSKVFNKRKEEFYAVKNFSFKVDQGKVFCLLGENGAGKTTTIKMLSTLLKPSRGDALINGFSITSQTNQVKSNIGLSLGDERSFYYRLTGFQNLEFYGKLFGLDKSIIKPRIISLLKNFDLITAKDKMFMNYSTGMKRRLSLCRAFLPDPSVVFLDEPSTGLDPHSAILVREIIKQMKKEGKTIVLSTQNLNEAEFLSDHLGIIKDGEMLLCSNINELMLNHRFSKVTIEFSELCEQNILSRFHSKIDNSKGNNRITYRVPFSEKPELIRSLFSGESKLSYKIAGIDIKDECLEDIYLSLYRKVS